MLISIVTPTYNRYELLLETIESIIEATKKYRADIEVIVIDDASIDYTYEKIHVRFIEQIDSGFLRIYRLPQNGGVTVAKNYGASMANGRWVMFLDSDDLLIPSQFSTVINELRNADSYAAVFLRCIKFDGIKVGEDSKGDFVGLAEYIKHGLYGERLPVIKRDVILKFPYEGRLRGFEGLAYFRMLSTGLKFKLPNIVARIYRTENMDRLSLQKARLRRSKEMQLGYFLLLKEYKKIKIKPSGLIRLKYLYYCIVCFISPKCD
jgi:glycosyltransferase involved in cell wall biosynthesis